jgi:DinB family protein
MNSLSSELSHVISSAESVLKQVSEEESSKPILTGGWSRKQVLGHLIDSASNNHQRFVRAALQGSLDFPGYDQQDWVRVQAVEEAHWPTLVTLWASYNRHLAHIIAHLPPAKLESACRIGSNEPVTLRFIAQDYLRHLLHHLAQLGAIVPASRT